MALPIDIDRASPADADNPSAGAANIRDLKDFLESVFGLTDASNYTAAAFSITTGGIVTVSQYLALGVGIGAAGSANTGLSIGGSFTAAAAQIGRGLNVSTAITGAAGQNIDGVRLALTFVEAASGVHALLASHRIDIATVTGGVATVTDTASLYIQGAMSATVTGANYALWVDAGNVRLDGILLSGTTVTTSASAGEAVFANAGHLRGVNAAGTDTVRAIGIDSSDDVAIGGGGSGDAYAKVKINAAASLPSGAAARNGLITFDTTNNRVVFYSGGNRYYVTTDGTF